MHTHTSAGSCTNEWKVYDGFFGSTTGLVPPAIDGFSAQKSGPADLILPKDAHPQPGQLHLIKQNFQVMTGTGRDRRKYGM